MFGTYVNPNDASRPGVSVGNVKRYLAIEGGDGSGKSTVVAAVTRLLERAGHVVVSVREPGGTPLGETIRGLLLDSERLDPWAEVHLFAAQRCELAREVIVPALQRDGVVVSDRSYYSSIAYQGGARGLGMDLVRLINETGLDATLPDAVFFLDVDPGLGLRRQHREDRIGGQGLEFQEAVRDAYLHLVDQDPKVTRLDGSAGVDELADEIVRALE